MSKASLGADQKLNPPASDKQTHRHSNQTANISISSSEGEADRAINFVDLLSPPNRKRLDYSFLHKLNSEAVTYDAEKNATACFNQFSLFRCTATKLAKFLKDHQKLCDFNHPHEVYLNHLQILLMTRLKSSYPYQYSVKRAQTEIP